MSDHCFTLFADYHQFHLQDDESGGIDGTAWDEAALQTRVTVMEGAFAVSTARDMEVPVHVAIADRAPALDLANWDHAVAFSITVPSGRLAILGCTGYLPDAARLEVPAGVLRVRVLFAGLDSLSEDGLEGDDRYHVEMWPGTPIAPEVLKQA